jgi:mannose-1-phosphate guanylyltransferase
MAIHATILAGGSGTRLWPRSRRRQPKHLLALQHGSAPLLRQTYERIRRLVDDVYVVTEQHQVESIREVIPEIGQDHIIVEPVARGTTSALGLAAMTIRERDGDAVMLSIPADHIVGDSGRFRQTIRRVVRLAVQSSQLVTVGLTPYYPATGFGYIRTDGEVRFGRTTGLKVIEFIEKPAFDRAVSFVDDGGASRAQWADQGIGIVIDDKFDPQQMFGVGHYRNDPWFIYAEDVVKYRISF